MKNQIQTASEVKDSSRTCTLAHETRKNQSRAMEVDTISRNGASSTSRKSKGNIRSIISAFALLICVNSLTAQDKIDTTYYSNDGKGIIKAFADFYRIALYPADANYKKMFRDFYISGELQGVGSFISIDKYDDNKSVFDGECIKYFKNGKEALKTTFRNGKRNGEFSEYSENGQPKVKGNYVDDQLSGVFTEFFENGSFTQIEYVNGNLKNDYYTINNAGGQVFKIRISDQKPIWEKPTVADRKTVHQDGRSGQFYDINGVIISLASTPWAEHGAWHRVDISITNNSVVPVEFDPVTDIAASSVDDRERITNLTVCSYDDYMRKVQRSQNFAAAMSGLSEGMANTNAGYTTTTTSTVGTYSGYSSYGYGYGGYGMGVVSGTSTTTTYDAAAAARARAESQNRMNELASHQAEQRKTIQQGYLKKNTIYPGQTVIGYVFVQRVAYETLAINLNINEALFAFDWVAPVNSVGSGYGVFNIGLAVPRGTFADGVHPQHGIVGDGYGMAANGINVGIKGVAPIGKHFSYVMGMQLFYNAMNSETKDVMAGGFGEGNFTLPTYFNLSLNVLGFDYCYPLSKRVKIFADVGFGFSFTNISKYKLTTGSTNMTTKFTNQVAPIGFIHEFGGGFIFNKIALGVRYSGLGKFQYDWETEAPGYSTANGSFDTHFKVRNLSLYVGLVFGDR